MFDLSWSEMLVVAVVAIVVVGPKDLPALMRTVGQWIGKAKRIARDFQRQLDDAVRDDELQKLQKQVAELSRNTTTDIRRGLDNVPSRYAPASAVVSASGADPVPPATTAPPPVMMPLPAAPAAEPVAAAVEYADGAPADGAPSNGARP